MQPDKKCSAIAFDSNVLLAIERKKADVFSMARGIFGGKAEFAITKQVREEMESLKLKGKAMERAVKVAFIALEKEQVKVLKTGAKTADLSLVEAASRGYCIATNDIALRKRIKEFGVAIIYLSRDRFLKVAW
ncbi:MAG: hypothetical protein JW744_04340 [Candidatus Diapherotrites archaeon]|uniref:VapC9 PIN-like domain-containing protein n=1 Tax=Candidatus Iainarchaeum sp. TaxID=3101447 RepID=A0A939CAD8_9ARCH|nr:hypothetical protein [Candidatus Diapherotrites archaeon]